jgi:hypothetical protein
MNDSTSSPPEPEVVLDLDHRDGVFLLVLANTGGATAYRPRVEFDDQVSALRGTLQLSELPLWTGLAMLRPGAQVEVVLDHTAHRRDGARRFAATVTYADRQGRRYDQRFEHDFGTYDGLPTLLS